MKTFLITGGAGFIGSHFVSYILKKYPDYKVVNADALTYAGNLENLADVCHHPNYTFVNLDIRHKENVKLLFDQYNFDCVVNFAAETHVDRSIEEPDVFLTTNVLGTQNLLEASKMKWKKTPLDKYSKDYFGNVKFIQISTDEVYGALGKEGKFNESMNLLPNSPYSASKASADLMVRAYHQTFGLPVNITRCSNNYGPNQFPEKLIPLMINNCLKEETLPVYGDGLQIRDWLHVWDHCSAIDAVLHRGNSGEVYNIGGNNEVTNIDLVKLIIKYLGKSESLIKYVKDRPGHDRRYAIDNSKITSELGWVPEYAFEKGISETIAWYLSNTTWMKNVTSGAYLDYYNRMYFKR